MDAPNDRSTHISFARRAFATIVCATSLLPTLLIFSIGSGRGDDLLAQWSTVGLVAGFLGGLALAARGSRWWLLLLIAATVDGYYLIFEFLGRMH